MRKEFVFSLLVITMLCLASGDQNSDYNQLNENIEKVVVNFSIGSLNKDTLLRQLGEYKRIYTGEYARLSYYDSNWNEWNREDCGNFFVKKGECWIGLIYENKECRDSGFSPRSVVFDDRDGFPIAMLVDIFGEWIRYTNDKELLTKYPRFRFKKQIDEEKELDIMASEIFGPFESPMKCVCKHFSISIKKKIK
jgi:hypothetical protein